MNASPETCYGREWELQQLHTLLNHAETECKTKVAFLSGMIGIGKTCLLGTFTKQLATNNKKVANIEVCATPHSKGFSIALLLKLLLKISEADSYDDVKNKTQLVFSSTKSAVRVLYLMNYALDSNQMNALANINKNQLDEIDAHIANDLLAYLGHKKVSVVAIDGLHLLTHDEVTFIRHLTQVKTSAPVLIVLTAQNNGLFTYLPSWLSSAHSIPIKELDAPTLETIAKSTLAKQGVCPHKYREKIDLAIRRINGNPLFLNQLLIAPNIDSSLPEKLTQSIKSTLDEMPPDACAILKLASHNGQHFDSKQLHQFSSHKAIKFPLCMVQKLLKSGLVTQTTEHFSFVHPMVCEAIKHHTRDFEDHGYKPQQNRQNYQVSRN